MLILDDERTFDYKFNGILTETDDITLALLKEAQEANEASTIINESIIAEIALVVEEVDALVHTIPKIKPSTDLNKSLSKEWAHLVDVNAEFSDFYERVPEMAHQVEIIFITFNL